MKHILRLCIVALVAVLGTTSAFAAGGKAEKVIHNHWHFSGPFGTFDQDALQRGYQVYETVCSSCHGLELLSFRNLGQKGGPFHLDSCPAGVPETIDCSNPNDNPVVKALAANYRFQVTDGPDDSGDMFQRPALPSDRFPSPTRMIKSRVWQTTMHCRLISRSSPKRVTTALTMCTAFWLVIRTRQKQ